VRFTGVGKNGVGVEDEAVAGWSGFVEVEAEDEVEYESADLDDEAIGESEGVGAIDPAVASDVGRPAGAVIPKVSPAPSQSELVSSGV
jgi:hypothetical protein